MKYYREATDTDEATEGQPRKYERKLVVHIDTQEIPEIKVLLEANKSKQQEIDRLKKLLRDLPKSFGITEKEIECKDYRTSTAREKERK